MRIGVRKDRDRLEFERDSLQVQNSFGCSARRLWRFWNKTLKVLEKDVRDLEL